MTRTYAALVTDENVDSIIEEAAKWDLKIDHLKDEYKDEYADFGVQTYAILSINYTTRQATFTTMCEESFNDTWWLSDWGHSRCPVLKVAALKNPKPR